MTKKQIIRLLKYLKRKKQFSWNQIKKHLHNRIEFDEFIDLFFYTNYIKLVTPRKLSNGSVFYTPDDIFTLDITAYDLLDDVKDSFFLYRLPIILSILAIMKSYKIGPDDIIFWCIRQLGL